MTNNNLAVIAVVLLCGAWLYMQADPILAQPAVDHVASANAAAASYGAMAGNSIAGGVTATNGGSWLDKVVGGAMPSNADLQNQLASLGKLAGSAPGVGVSSAPTALPPGAYLAPNLNTGTETLVFRSDLDNAGNGFVGADTVGWIRCVYILPEGFTGPVELAGYFDRFWPYHDKAYNTCAAARGQGLWNGQ